MDPHLGSVHPFDRRWFAAVSTGRRGRRGRLDVRALLHEEPFSRLAIWSRRLSLFAVTLAAIALVLLRSGAVEVPAALAVLGAALVLALVALPLAAAALVIVWRTGRRGVRVVMTSCFLALLLFSYPAYLASRSASGPIVNDISTDAEDPPAFSRASAAVAARAGRKPGHGFLPTPAVRARLYADLSPIIVDMEPIDAYELVLRVAGDLHWKIVATLPPGGREGIGHLDAVDRTLLLGLPDDIAIRIRPHGDGSQIDVRSAARYGLRDFGTNADRVRRFIEAINEQIGPR